jgi:serine/threonine protein kinase
MNSLSQDLEQRRFDAANRILEAALDVCAADRDAFAACACGPDTDLLTEVRRLLGVIGGMGGFLEEMAACPPEIRGGDLLGGRFKILRKLGEGGMGSVFLAEDAERGPVALKVLRPDRQADPLATARLRNEVEMARGISHPNVCPVFDLFNLEHRAPHTLPAFTMKYLPGETLAARLLRGPLPLPEALSLARDIAAGLDALHAAGIVHRDLKPANIVLTTGPEGAERAVITDFGLATAQGSNATDSETGLNRAGGSPDYMAPEQFRKAPPAIAADLYAFGLILFEMITGQRPFPQEDLLATALRRVADEAPEPASAAAGISSSWNAAVVWTLARIPGHRPASAAAVIAKIENVQEPAGAACRAVRPPRVTRPWHTVRRWHAEEPHLLRTRGHRL